MTKRMDIITNPSKYFHNPRELYKSKKLTDEEKIHAIENWINEEVQQSAATNENMPLGCDDDYDDLLLELHKLLENIRHH